MTKKRKIKESKIRDRFVKLKSSLNEGARRLFVANEAIAFGYGGIAAASRAMGMAASVIGRGMYMPAQTRDYLPRLAFRKDLLRSESEQI